MARASAQENEEESLFDGTPFRSLGVIGEGGMGTVHLVEQRTTHAKFVVKVIHRSLVPDIKAVDRFRLEAQSLAQIDHPNIVEVKGTGATSDGRPFIVMEHLQGRTLSEELKLGDFSVETSVNYACQYLLALKAAHTARIVHRDLKPANIFITKDEDGKPLVKVLDFGLAKVLPDAPTGAPSSLINPTTMGVVIGTPRYMSPEQAMGRESDERGDIYAAAVILYKCLTGDGPFDHWETDRQMEAHVTAKPEPPSKYSHGKVSKQLDAAVLKGLSKDPKQRFSTADEFRQELLSCLRANQPVGRASTLPLEKLPKTKSVLLFVVTMVVTLALAVFGQLWLARP